MPELWVRYHAQTGEIYEAQFALLVTGQPSVEAVDQVGEHAQTPDSRLTRVDMITKTLRAATVQEMTDWDETRKTNRARNDFELKIIQALALALLGELNALRQQSGLPLRTAAQLRQAVIDQYKGL